MNTLLRVLIVEDSEDDALLLMRELKRGGYDPAFERVDTLEAMNATLDKQTWDIVICDHTMPHFNSLAALRLLQERGIDLPFIIVSGTIGEDIAVEAMKAGAHDYLMKSNLVRLVPAVERELKEAGVRRECKRAEEELKQTLEKLQKTLVSTVQAMSQTVEIRDPYTAGHQRKVAELAYTIATEIGLPKEQINWLYLTAIIHDIGKIYVPAEILSKPGRLSKFEFDIIKAHAQVGYDILKVIEFPWAVADIVLQHHERLDGSGYPNGLSDDNILLEAKVIAVADVVEAMASHRPYRPALGIDKALEEISRGRGILYDADVVDACLKVFTEKGFKFE